jgi:hypothetical protein
MKEMSLPSSYKRRVNTKRSNASNEAETHGQGTLETLFHKHLVLCCQRHLQRNQRRPEYGYCADDAEYIVSLESFSFQVGE